MQSTTKSSIFDTYSSSQQTNKFVANTKQFAKDIKLTQSKWLFLLAIIAALVIFLFSFQTEAQAGEKTKKSKIKNVIVLIGDGMGVQQMGLLRAYAKNAANSIYLGKKTGITKLMEAGVIGLSMHNPAGHIVVDSAASATQLSTAKSSGSEMIGVDADGNSAETILEKAAKMGKSTGLVSDTRITHATPAAFAAHQPHRSLENEIAVDLLNNDVDVMLSGGLRYWIPKSANNKDGAVYQKLVKMSEGNVRIKSKRKDERNLLSEAQKKGYKLAFNKKQMKKAKNGKLLGLFAYSGMPDGIINTQTKNDPNRTSPTLTEMTKKAVELLSKNKKGFFLMVEGGQIDWAGHDNDTGTMLHEMIKFDNAVKYIYNWAKDREDTLVILTADHETGSFGFSYSIRNLPKGKTLAGNAFKNREFKPNYNFGSNDILDKIYAQKASFVSIFGEFDSLPKTEQTAKSLMIIVNKNNEFKITQKDAERVLETGENEYYVKGHAYLDSKVLPKVYDFKAFYAYGSYIRHSNLGRVLAKHQNTVWGTGTHTNAPVAVVAMGPSYITSQFSGFIHHTKLAKYAIRALSNKRVQR